MILWPCSTCGADGYRNLGTQGLCAAHLGDLLRSFDPSVFSEIGVGLPGRSGDLNDLTCVRCGATWVGFVGDNCWWCWRSHASMLEHQADLVMRGPEPAEDRMVALAVWAKRLAVAVKGGIVTEQQARRALAREMGSDAVAV